MSVDVASRPARRWVLRPVSSKSTVGAATAVDNPDAAVLQTRRVGQLERRWMLGSALEGEDAISQPNRDMIWLKLENGNVVAAKTADVLPANDDVDFDESIDLAALEHVHLPALTRALQQVFAQGKRAVFVGDTLAYFGAPTVWGDAALVKSALERHDPVRELAAAVRASMAMKQANQVVLATGVVGSGRAAASYELVRALTGRNGHLRRVTNAASRVLRAFTSSIRTRGGLRSHGVVSTELRFAASTATTPCASRVSALFFEPWRVAGEQRLAVLQLMRLGLGADSLARLGLSRLEQRGREGEPGSATPGSCGAAAVGLLDEDHDGPSYSLAQLVDDLELAGLDESARRHVFSTLAAVAHLCEVSFVQRGDGRVAVSAPAWRGIRVRPRPRSTGPNFSLRRHTSAPSEPNEAAAKSMGRSWMLSSLLLSSASASGKDAVLGPLDPGAELRPDDNASGRASKHLPSLKRYTSMRSSTFPKEAWSAREEHASPPLGPQQVSRKLLLHRDSEPLLRPRPAQERLHEAGGELPSSRRAFACGPELGPRRLQGSPLEKAAFTLGLDAGALESALCADASDCGAGESNALALAKSLYLGLLAWIEQQVNKTLSGLEPLSSGAQSVTIVECLPTAVDWEHADLIDGRSFEQMLSDLIGESVENDIFDHVVLGEDNPGVSYAKELFFGSLNSAGLLAELEEVHSRNATRAGGATKNPETKAAADVETVAAFGASVALSSASRSSSTAISSTSTLTTSWASSSFSSMCSEHEWMYGCEGQAQPGCEAYRAGRTADFARKNHLGSWQGLLKRSALDFVRALPTGRHGQVLMLYRQDVGRFLSWLMSAGDNVHFVRCMRAFPPCCCDTLQGGCDEVAEHAKGPGLADGETFCEMEVLRQVAANQLVMVARRHRIGAFANRVSLQTILMPYRGALPLADQRRDPAAVVQGILDALAMRRDAVQVEAGGVRFTSRAIADMQVVQQPDAATLERVRAARVRAAWRRCAACALAASRFLGLFAASRERVAAAAIITQRARRSLRAMASLRREQAAVTIQRALWRYWACAFARTLLRRLRVAARVREAKRAIRVRARETARLSRRTPPYPLTG